MKKLLLFFLIALVAILAANFRVGNASAAFLPDPGYPGSCTQYPNTPWECSDGTEAQSNWNYVMGSNFGYDGSSVYCGNSGTYRQPVADNGAEPVGCNPFDPTSFWTWTGETTDDSQYRNTVGLNVDPQTSGAAAQTMATTGLACEASTGIRKTAPLVGPSGTINTYLHGHSYSACPRTDNLGNPIAYVEITITVCLQRNDVAGNPVPIGVWKFKGGCTTATNSVGRFAVATRDRKICTGSTSWWWRTQTFVWIKAVGYNRSYFPRRAIFSSKGHLFDNCG